VGTPSGQDADPCAPITNTVRTLVPADIVQKKALLDVPVAERRIGRWTSNVISRAEEVGRFDAVTQGFGPNLVAYWSIDDRALDGTAGDVELPDVVVHYDIDGTKLVLRPHTERDFELLLAVTVIDERGATLTARRCVRYHYECTKTDVRYTPT